MRNIIWPKRIMTIILSVFLTVGLTTVFSCAPAYAEEYTADDEQLAQEELITEGETVSELQDADISEEAPEETITDEEAAPEEQTEETVTEEQTDVTVFEEETEAYEGPQTEEEPEAEYQPEEEQISESRAAATAEVQGEEDPEEPEEVKEGWYEEDGYRYYYINGEKATSQWITEGSSRYWVDSEGRM
ncbi:MAG: hypothetical protein IJH69_05630, partial [Firmicutes bacterium]|nr:hypothetical protein [Bacillota bacterium]